MTHPTVGCTVCQFDRQVYGFEIEFAKNRRRPAADTRCAELVATMLLFVQRMA
jgi:hypothetical protein